MHDKSSFTTTAATGAGAVRATTTELHLTK